MTHKIFKSPNSTPETSFSRRNAAESPVIYPWEWDNPPNHEAMICVGYTTQLVDPVFVTYSSALFLAPLFSLTIYKKCEVCTYKIQVHKYLAMNKSIS